MSAAPFVEQVQGKPAATVAAVVKQALGRANVYFYGQLYNRPEVQALKGQPVFEVLTVFTYGTLADLDGLSAAAKEIISANMTAKLRRLTLVTLAGQNRRLSYEQLFRSLGVQDGRELEDIVIDAATEGLINARIDQAQRTVEVAYAACRDVRREDVGRLKKALLQWSNRCTQTVKDLDKLIQDSKAATANEQLMSRGIVDAESVLADECKKELLTREALLEDEEYGIPAGARAAARRR